MCDPSHIELAAAGTRVFLCQFRSARVELEATGNAFRNVLTEPTLRLKLAIEAAASEAGWILAGLVRIGQLPLNGA
jgi:hypothetical protein